MNNHLKIGETSLRNVASQREEIGQILKGEDPRTLVIAGPCSLDDSVQSDGELSIIKYAKQLLEHTKDNSNVKVVLRAPPLKPRTSTGWEGLHSEAGGIEKTISIFEELNKIGIPIAIEAMNPNEQLAAYGHLVCAVWLGARSAHSPLERSQLSAVDDCLPILIKNSATGCPEQSWEQTEASIRMQRKNLLVPTSTTTLEQTATDGFQGVVGKIFRGTESVDKKGQLLLLLTKLQHNAGSSGLLVDLAHDTGRLFCPNSEKTAKNQQLAVELLTTKLTSLPNLMIESYLTEGLGDKPGQSRTDPCLSISDTLRIIGNI